MRPLNSCPSPALKGDISIPGDKSISHRALIFGTLACGETVIHGLLESDDIGHTADAMRHFGAVIERHDDGTYHVFGPGVGLLLEPENPLYFGNAGTGSRLVMGLAASHAFSTSFDGDESLRKRPMARILEPLSGMGARIDYHTQADRLPLTISGASPALPLAYRLPVASAQVKSAILLAALNTFGETSVIEPEPTRDHTERMIKAFGGALDTCLMPDGAQKITVTGQKQLMPQIIHVPADPSSAAFPMVAALIVKGSHIRLNKVMMNPTRTGLITTLKEMNAKIAIDNVRDEAGETVADITVSASELKAVDVPAERAPTMIDEYPVLAVAASFAEGQTIMRGLSELRVKESDRLAAIDKNLRVMGVDSRIEDDNLIVNGGKPKGGGFITTELDHRIAMSFLVMGLACPKGASIDDTGFIATSFPDFIDLMAGLGARFEV